MYRVKTDNYCVPHAPPPSGPPTLLFLFFQPARHVLSTTCNAHCPSLPSGIRAQEMGMWVCLSLFHRNAHIGSAWHLVRSLPALAVSNSAAMSRLPQMPSQARAHFPKHTQMSRLAQTRGPAGAQTQAPDDNPPR